MEFPLNATDALNLGLCVDGTQAAAGAVAGILNGAKLHLTKTHVPTGPDAVLADLLAAEATFTGYASSVLAWAAAGTESDDGHAENVATLVHFQPTDAVAPNLIYDVFITNAGGTALYLCGTLPAAANMNDALHQLDLIVRWRPDGHSVAEAIV